MMPKSPETIGMKNDMWDDLYQQTRRVVQLLNALETINDVLYNEVFLHISVELFDKRKKVTWHHF